MKYIFYKHKVAGPIKGDELDKFIPTWVHLVDTYGLNNIPDTPFLNEDMANYPNEVHILMKEEA